MIKRDMWFNNRRRWVVVWVLCAGMCSLICGDVKAEDMVQVVQPQLNRYTGVISSGAALHAPTTTNIIDIQPGYFDIRFSVLDGANGNNTALSLTGMCNQGNLQLTMNGTPVLTRLSGTTWQLKIPVRSGNRNWKWGSKACEMSYSIQSQTRPSVQLLGAWFRHDNGSATKHYISFAYLNTVLGNGADFSSLISYIGGWEHDPDVTGKSGAIVPIPDPNVTTIVPEGNLNVLYEKNTKLNSSNGFSSRVIHSTGNGSVSASWDSDKGAGSEIEMVIGRNGEVWRRGTERSLKAGEEIYARAPTATQNVWGVRAENIVVQWSIK